MKSRSKLEKLLAYLVVLFFVIGLVPMKAIKATTDELTTKTVTILATTDLHGRFVPYDYARATKSDGGLTQIATLVNAERQKNSNTILVDNGDNIQGNYNHLFLNDEKNPMMEAMNYIGYDSFTLGNHEFNFGMDTLNKITNQLDKTVTLCANLYKDNERVFTPYIIKTVEDGIKVAVIGVVTPHIDRWDGPNLAGYTPTNPTEEVKKVIEEIKNEGGADVYVVTAHMGFESEYGDGDSAKEIAEGNLDVDVVVMGHSHETKDGVKAGNAILIQPTNNAGSLGKVELKLTKKDGKYEISSTASSLIKTTGVQEDANLVELLKSYDERAKTDANQVIGTLEGESLADDNEISDIPESLVRDQGITDFVNEVQLYNAKKHLEDKGIKSDDVYLVSAAALFDADSNMKSGEIKKSDVSKIYKYDNKLYTIKTTGKQLKSFMEWTSSIYNTFKPGDLTVSLNEKVRLYQYDMFSGISYDINISKAPGNRIENLKFQKDGKVVEDSDVVYLSVNNYRYDSVLVGLGVFEEGTHEKIYDTNNDSISDMRDLIIDYIQNEKDGTIKRSIDNNWKLTGVSYDSELRAEAVRLVKEGKLQIPKSADGRTPNVRSLTLDDVLKALNKKRVEILTFNDFHGNVEESGKNIGAAKLATIIKEKTSLNASSNYEAIPVSGGDLYQGTAISNLTHGAPVTEFLKEIGLKASAVGNHEFDWNRSDILNWANEGNFNFLAANVVSKSTGKPVDWAKPYEIIEVDGLKIGLIGITTPETAYKTKPENVSDLSFLDPTEIVNKYAKELKEDKKVNAVVVLSHLGAKMDSTTKKVSGEAVDLANGVTNVDAIIASHDHQFTNAIVNNIPIIEAGYNGRGLGILSFDFDENGGLINVKGTLDEAYKRSSNIVPDETVLNIVNKYKAELKPILSEKITDLDKTLDHDSYSGLTPLGTVVSETMRKITDADIAITNGGGIRAPLQAGEITIGDLYTIIPFDNTLFTMELKGSDIKKAIEHGIMPANMGWGQFSGIKVWYDKDAKAGERVTSIRLQDGTPLDMDKYYKVVTNDFMATGGDGYNFSNAKNLYDTNLVMRDEIVKEWKANGINTKIDNLLIAGVDDTKDTTKPNTEDTNNTNSNTNSNTNLPLTGGENSVMVAIFAIMLSGIGYTMFKKNKNKEVN